MSNNARLFIEIAPSNSLLFSNANKNDICFKTSSSNQSFLFGIKDSPLSTMAINSSNIVVYGQLGIGSTSNPGESFEVRQGNALFESNVFVLQSVGIGNTAPSEALEITRSNAKIGSNLYVINAATIGKNNSNPSETLDVGSNIKVGSNIYALNAIGIMSSNPTEALDVMSNIKVRNNLFIANSLAIGGSNPQASLDVQSNAIFRSNVNMYRTLAVGTSNTASETVEVVGNQKVSGNSYILTSLNVGGSNPSEAFDVRLNAKVRSNLYVVNAISIGGLSNPLQTVDIQGNIRTVGNIFVHSNIAVGSSSSNPTERLDIIGNMKVSSNAYIMSRLGVGISNPTESVQVNGNILASNNIYSFGSLGMGTVFPTEKADVYGNLKVSSNTYIFGSLGISKSNPTEKIEVIGNIKATGNVFAQNIGLGAITVSEQLDLQSNLKVRSNAYIMNSLGVATSNPTEVVDIVGNTKINSNLYVLSNLGVNTSNPTEYIDVVGNLKTSSNVYAMTSLGVATSNPQEILDVNGNLKARSNIYVMSNLGVNTSNPMERIDVVGNLKTSSNVYAMNSLGVATSNPQEILDVNGNLKARSNVYVMSNLGIATSNPTEKIDVIGNLKVRSNAYVLSNLGINTSNPTERIDVVGNFKTSSNVYAMNSLGVATSNPTEKIDVVGNIKASSNIYAMNSLSIATSNPQEILDVNGNLKARSNVYVLSNLGINTSNPTERIDVVGNFKTSSNVYAMNSLGVATSNPTEKIDVVGNIKASSNIYAMNSLSIATSNPQEILDVNGNLKARSNVYVLSNLGIGNSNPTEKIDVIGNVKSSSNVYAMNTLGVATSNPTEKIDVVGNVKASSNVYAMNSLGIATSNLQEILDVNGNLKARSNVYVLSNLSVANSNPTERVDVTGNLKVSSNIYAMNLVGVATSNPTEVVDVNGNLKVRSNMYILSNLGIGTSNPLYKADVNGTILCRFGNTMSSYSSNQILFGFNGTNTYMHAINSRHNSNGVAQNSIDFMLWSSNVASNVVGTCNPMSISANGVGIFNNNPQYAFDVLGNGRFVGGLTACNTYINTSNEIGISPNAYNSLLIWDNQAATTTFTGTIVGNASRDTTSNYIQLTSNSVGVVGYAFWPINLGNAFHLSFDYFAGGGSGDGTQISFYSSFSNPSDISTGYNIFLDEYNIDGNDRVRTTANGTQIDNWDLGVMGYLDNSTWKRIDVQYVRGTFMLSIDSTRLRTIVDQERSFIWNTNTYFGILSKTGAATNFHRIRNLRVSKVDQGIWSQANMSNSADLYYPFGNIGIGTRAPGYKLEVGGSLYAAGYCNLLLDTFTSTSTSNAPTANALKQTKDILDTTSNTAFASSNLLFNAINNQSNTSLTQSIIVTATSNDFYASSNILFPSLSNTSNMSYAMSNTLFVRTSNTSNMAFFASNAGAFGSNLSVTSSNFLYPGLSNTSNAIFVAHSNTSNMAFFASNTAVAGSNRAYIWSNNTSNIFINTASNLGIGTSSPVTQLHVVGKVYADTQVLASSNDASNAPGFAFREDSNTGIMHSGTGALSIVTQGTERVRFDNAGNMGIGTSNPVTKLTLYGTDSSTLFGPHANFYTNTDNFPLMQLLPYAHNSVNVGLDTYWSNNWFSSTSNGNFLLSKGTNSFNILCSSNIAAGTSISLLTTAMSITSGGSVGIGTSNIGSLLDVNGFIATQGINNGGSITISNIQYPPIPMTSNTLSYNNSTYTISSSFSNTSFQAFNSNTSDVWEATNGGYSNLTGIWNNTLSVTTLVGTSNYAGHWIQIGLPSNMVVDEMLLYPKGGWIFDPKDTYIVGSTDNSNFTLLNYFNGLAMTSNSYRSYTINSNYTPYRFYRLIAASTQYSGNVALAEILFRTRGNVIVGFGNVGIGTTIPTYKLDVIGDINFRGTLRSNGVPFVSGTSNQWTSTASNTYISTGSNVGIGTIAPGYPLEVNGTARVGQLLIGSNTTSNAIVFAGVNGDGDVSSPHTIIMERLYDPNNGSNVTSDYSELLLAKFNDASSLTGPDRIRHVAASHKWQVYGGVATAGMTPTMLADSNFTNAMYIDSNANVGIGTISPSQKLHVVGAILASGDITAFSDERLKSNISPITNGLDKVLKLNGYTFDVKDDDKRRTGLLAQEVMDVLPEAVQEQNDGHYSLAYGNLAGLFVEAFKSMHQQMTGKINALESQIIALQAKL